ncbi:MAG TPA: tRNA uridine-5-carboxymethylaminomethyl(34) synthesis GTPase MnmE [Bacteroidia bacterium]|nr:tRNA uridine-5-carboxymethylaminomethyl(34) synthesis GTPase MnmE [Bacteroidia bacterium]
MKQMARDTIVALATAQGTAAIALIRLSGPQAFKIVSTCFCNRKKQRQDVEAFPAQSLHFGLICHHNEVLDEVLLSVFKSPASYTGEDVVEVSCHGSLFIQQQLLQLFLRAGARMAEPGEFTLRAFLNGKMDLSQAEAVADLIASHSAVSHQVAMQQMRGGFSTTIKLLREQLINFASLIELELDFSEEDVEFANRQELSKLVEGIQNLLSRLIQSFELGNVIKNGLPVAIVGKPNAGKSTLLNVLLEEDRAIVSEIPGTTRDTIEDSMVIEGVLFRFIDTAGLRDTSDVIEQIGVNKAYEAMKKSAIIIYLFDVHELSAGDLHKEVEALRPVIGDSQLLLVANKSDLESPVDLEREFSDFPALLFISAKEHQGIDRLRADLLGLFDERTLHSPETIVTNARHAQALKQAHAALDKVNQGMEASLPGDLLALEIRYALNELGQITGEVSNEDLLGNIFSKFCIGK